jgi:hypothetical protein
VLAVSKTVTFKLKVQGLETVNLQRDGAPNTLNVRAGGKDLELRPNREGEEAKSLPFRSSAFVITAALWRGFRLESPLNQSIIIDNNEAVINFTRDDDYADHCDVSEVRKLGKRFFGVKTDEELIKRLGLRPLPDKRVPTQELRFSSIRTSNKSGASITSTFFDCDEFVWKKDRPLSVSDCNLGTELIKTDATSLPVKGVFDSMSAYNRVLGVLVSWSNSAGTRRWFRLAGFIRPEPQENEKNRNYKITVIGDVENVSLESDSTQDRVTVIQ